MNIFLIAAKELKKESRNVRNLVLMILFPLVLMIILGTALSGMFNNNSSLGDIPVIYLNGDNQAVNQAMSGFITQGDKLDLELAPAQSRDQGLEGIKNGRFAAFLTTENGSIKLYKNERFLLKANIVETILESFMQRYNTISQIAANKPEFVPQLANENSADHLVLSSLAGKREPRAIDYYAVTMLTLIIIHSSLTGAYSIKGERNRKTAGRIMSAPVEKYQVLIGKIIGTLFITCLQVIVVLLVSKYLLKADWGDHMGIILLILLGEVAMAISLGIGFAFMIRDDGAANGIINLIIPVLVFLGGGYIPLEGMNKTLQLISDVSPIRWVNKAIFQVNFSNDFSSVSAALGICLGIAAVFLLVSSRGMRKEGL